MNTSSYTDEQLLNLVNNSIKAKTEFSTEQFSGGSISVTSVHHNTRQNYKVNLYFGYNGKNPITRSIEIKSDFYYIWSKAIHLKVMSIATDNLGADYNEMNKLMNGSNTVESISNKVESISTVLEGGIKDTLKGKKETVINTYKTQSDFSLPRDTLWSKTTEEYKKEVVKHIDAFIEEKRKLAEANGKYDWVPKIDSEDFILSMESKDYKYKNFVATYKTWLRR